MLAATLKNPELVDLLIDKGADVNARDYRGYTALMAAAYYGNEHCVKRILQKKPDINWKASDGNTALSFAKKRKHTKIAKILKANGAK